jgi:hypothetical protein
MPIVLLSFTHLTPIPSPEGEGGNTQNHNILPLLLEEKGSGDEVHCEVVKLFAK